VSNNNESLKVGTGIERDNCCGHYEHRGKLHGVSEYTQEVYDSLDSGAFKF
jgi:hypothetical protein